MNAKFSKDEAEKNNYKGMFQQPRMKLKQSASKKTNYNHRDYNYIFPESDYRNNTDNTKAQFAYIRELIKDKRYDIARRELMKLEHERAEDWLQKLNKIDPAYKLALFDFKLNVLSFYMLLILVVLVIYIKDLASLNMATTTAMIFVLGSAFMAFFWLRSRSR